MQRQLQLPPPPPPQQQQQHRTSCPVRQLRSGVCNSTTTTRRNTSEMLEKSKAIINRCANAKRSPTVAMVDLSHSKQKSKILMNGRRYGLYV
ncbi:tRNA-dihydrouridine(47) synthase [NAD(P)(+)]-like [Trichinella spiralis]|uniref:tRNA-dihydrouridine(47) synthase [NAD(P)(+)]-like n=1 Tax=Trichinella spiralis TaxID=6334 RepID=A0ABR3KPI2_TRISP